jgi:protein-S-isoprenylcysteine O-methyltransferase Ste14
VGVPLAHGVLPWALSRIGIRHGWEAGRPSAWNLIGLAPVAAGVVVLAWCFVGGLARVHELPRRMEGLGFPLLMDWGPYAFSRNPMYVGEFTLWLGWSILYGSVAVLFGFLALVVTIALVVPREERGLEGRFGESYRRYKAAVPRWLGRPRRGLKSES